MNIGFNREPAMWIALGDAVVILAITLGAPITNEQKAAADAVLTAIAGVLIRSQVSPAA